MPDIFAGLDIRRRLPQAAQRPGPEGREMARGASVEASKTPTAEAVSKGRWSRRDERTERGGPSFFCGSKSARSARGAAGLGSRGRVRRTGADTQGLPSGGSGLKRCLQGTFWGHGPPEEAFSPGSSRGFDARGLRIPVHLKEQVGEQVGERAHWTNEHKS